jgi:outer membrane protein assembly factor BamB
MHLMAKSFSASLATLVAMMLFNVFADSRCAGDESAWPQFRGPSGQGRTNASLPVDLTAPANQVWATKPVGIGWSSPVVANGQVWLTSAITVQATEEEIAKKRIGAQFADTKTTERSAELHAICIDAESGKILHDKILANLDSLELSHPLNSYATPTPVIAGNRVVCHFGSYGTWCLDTNSGKVVWDTKLVIDHSIGPASSPVVYRDKVLLVCDCIDKQFVAAVSIRDGKLVWKSNRPNFRATNVEYMKAYSTPLLIEVDEKPMAVIPGAQWTVAYEPDTGKEIWRADCGDGFSTTPMAVYDDGLVVVSTGFHKPELVAIRPDGHGDVTETHIAWKVTRGVPALPCAVTLDGYIFTITDAGVMTCFEIKTGKEVNKVRIGGNFSSSILLANKLLYVSDHDGKVSVVTADPELKTIATNDFDCRIFASHAVVGNDLIIRTEKEVIRVADKASLQR